MITEEVHEKHTLGKYFPEGANLNLWQNLGKLSPNESTYCTVFVAKIQRREGSGGTVQRGVKYMCLPESGKYVALSILNGIQIEIRRYETEITNRLPDREKQGNPGRAKEVGQESDKAKPKWIMC